MKLKIIKRYQNRKLYDVNNAKYININEVINFIKDGGNIKVTCNKTKDDITKKTLLTCCTSLNEKGNDEIIEFIRG